MTLHTVPSKCVGTAQDGLDVAGGCADAMWKTGLHVEGVVHHAKVVLHRRNCVHACDCRLLLHRLLPSVEVLRLLRLRRIYSGLRVCARGRDL